MAWMNEHDVATAVAAFNTTHGRETAPNLAAASRVLARLVIWTNENSDGWPYWVKPSRASKRLQEHLSTALSAYFRGQDPEDITAAELRAALTPVKAFLTRQGVDHAQIGL